MVHHMNDEKDVEEANCVLAFEVEGTLVFYINGPRYYKQDPMMGRI